MVKLVYNDHTGRERFVEMGAQNTVVMVGRNPECSIQTNNASVSRVHAMLTYKDGKLLVQDPPNGKPMNGTKVDGMRLQPGEVLELFANSDLLCGNFHIKILDSVGDRIAHMDGYAAQNAPYQQYPQGGADAQKANSANYDPRLQQAPNAAYTQSQAAYANAPKNQGFVAKAAAGSPNATVQGFASAPQNFDQKDRPRDVYRTEGDPGTSRGPFDQNQNMRGAAFDSGRNKRMTRGAGSSAYHPAQQHAAPAMNGAASAASPNKPMPSGDLSAAGREYESLRANNAALEEEIKSLKSKLEDRDRELSDISQRCECNDSFTTSLNDMIKNLKDQLDHQKEQNNESKKELADALERSNSLEIEIATLRESLESKGMASSNAESTINDLKGQVSSLKRQLSEVRRELDLAQCNVREERENAERLEENVTSLNAALEESQRHCRDMKKVVEQHESMFDELRANLEDKTAEVRQLQDLLKKSGSGNAASALNELSQVKDALSKKTSECESLKKEMAALQAAAQNAPAAGDSSSLVDVPHLKEVSQSISDAVGQWRGDLQTLENSISDLQRAFVPYVRLDVNSLKPQDKARVENMLKQYDPRAIFEDIGNALELSQTCLGELKGHIVELKTSLDVDDA